MKGEAASTATAAAANSNNDHVDNISHPKKDSTVVLFGKKDRRRLKKLLKKASSSPCVESGGKKAKTKKPPLSGICSMQEWNELVKLQRLKRLDSSDPDNEQATNSKEVGPQVQWRKDVPLSTQGSHHRDILYNLVCRGRQDGNHLQEEASQTRRFAFFHVYRYRHFVSNRGT